MKPINVLIVVPGAEHRSWLVASLSGVAEFMVAGAGADLIGACGSCSPHIRVDVLVTKLRADVSPRIEWWAVVHATLPGVRMVGILEEADDKADTRWTLGEVLAAMGKGDAFFTVGTSSGRRAGVESVPCPSCKRTIIRSSPDAVTDNNLDGLRRCHWS